MTDDPSAPLITVWFVLAGDDFDADACSAAVDLAPTSIWRQKRPELRDRADLDNMNWSYGVEKLPEYSTDSVVQAVLAEIWPRRSAIAAFAAGNRLSASVCCNVTIHENRPVYELSADSMRKLAELNAEFRMNVFDYSA